MTCMRETVLLKSFVACIEDDLKEKEAEEFRKGLDSKVKLDLYRRFGGKREFKKYLHGRSDEGAIDSCLSLDQEHMV